jgi:hypothetical protein
LVAYTYLDNSDKTMYGSILTGLQMQQSLKNNQYPKTITEANHVLSNHCHNQNNSNSKRNYDKAAKDLDKESKEKEELPEMSFATMEGKCYYCGKGGHKSPACCMKDKIPRE